MHFTNDGLATAKLLAQSHELGPIEHGVGIDVGPDQPQREVAGIGFLLRDLVDDDLERSARRFDVADGEMSQSPVAGVVPPIGAFSG